jgi:hypothetical protein
MVRRKHARGSRRSKHAARSVGCMISNVSTPPIFRLPTILTCIGSCINPYYLLAIVFHRVLRTISVHKTPLKPPKLDLHLSQLSHQKNGITNVPLSSPTTIEVRLIASQHCKSCNSRCTQAEEGLAAEAWCDVGTLLSRVGSRSSRWRDGSIATSCARGCVASCTASTASATRRVASS